MKKKYRTEASLFGIGIAIITTFLAKGIGFCRELLMASVFGATEIGDAFIVALSIPDILISGFSVAIATLYIPTFFLIKNQASDKKDISKFNSSVLALIMMIGLILIVIVEIFPSTIVGMFASGFDYDVSAITILLLRITIISVIPIFLGSYFKAFGQIINKFAILTILSCVINITIIIGLLLYNGRNIDLLGYSVILGNSFYAIIAYLIIRKHNFTFSLKFSLNNKYLIGMLIGMIPVFASNIIAEINQIIDKNFASQLVVGTVSALNYSSKIINLITAILGTAISSVLFTNLSRIATSGDNVRLAKEVKKINCLLFSVLIPIMYFIVFFSKQIITVLFGHGNFSGDSIIITSECLIFYSIGILGFNLKAIWIRVYNASMNTKTPAINSAIAVVSNIILNLIFISYMKHKGLALATGLSSIFTDILLICKYKKFNKEFDLEGTMLDSIKSIFASIVVLPIMYIGSMYCDCNLNSFLIYGLSSLMICYLVYMTLLILMKTETGIYLKNIIKEWNTNDY